MFATGNDYSSTVGYPANCNPDILAVGSNNRNGSRSSFSNYGTALDIVAPGENPKVSFENIWKNHDWLFCGGSTI